MGACACRAALRHLEGRQAMHMSWYGLVETLKHPKGLKCHALKDALKEMPSKKSCCCCRKQVLIDDSQKEPSGNGNGNDPLAAAPQRQSIST